MKRIMAVCASLLVVMLIASDALSAEHPGGGQMPMGGQAGQQEQPTGRQPMMGGGMMGPGTMGMPCPMMGMMGPMMGGMMDPSGMGMMGMMGGGQMDSKAMGRMLQLRGEMLKAVGEVLLKHGKAMEEGK